MTAALNLGLIILIAGAGSLSLFRLALHFRQRKSLATGLVVMAVASMLVCAGSSVTALGVVDYAPISPEPAPTIEIDMRQKDNNLFHVHLLHIGKAGWQHTLQGSFLCLRLHEIGWTRIASDLGLRPLFRLAVIQSSDDVTFHLPGRERLPIWSFSRNHPWIFWIHARPALHICLPMITGARYQLDIRPGYIVTRPLNPEASNALLHHAPILKKKVFNDI